MDQNIPVFYPSSHPRSSEPAPETPDQPMSLSPSIHTTSKKIVLRTRRQSTTFVTLIFLIGVLIGLGSGVIFGLFN
jgi:hypothetical protein